MIIRRIADATRLLGQSQGYIGLPIRDEVIDEGVNGPRTPCMTTAWEPTPDELARLNVGAPVYLRVLGTAHPPVMMDVGEVPEFAAEVTISCDHPATITVASMGRSLTASFKEAQANAALIVQAVNERDAVLAERDELRAALTELMDALDSDGLVGVARARSRILIARADLGRWRGAFAADPRAERRQARVRQRLDTAARAQLRRFHAPRLGHAREGNHHHQGGAHDQNRIDRRHCGEERHFARRRGD